MWLHSAVAAAIFALGSVAAFEYWAFDTVDRLNSNHFPCIRQNAYSSAILRFYSPENGGSVDQHGLTNIKLAINSRYFLVDGYIEPSLSGLKSPIKQFREAMKALKEAEITGKRIWLKVSSPYFWGRSGKIEDNVEFVRDFVEEGRLNGIKVGIYTNWYDWAQITQNSTKIQPPLIWYWQASGPTHSGQGDANFKDYQKFAAMPQKPTFKQYGLGLRVCSANINKSGFDSTSFRADSALSFTRDGVAEAEILRRNLAGIHRTDEIRSENLTVTRPTSEAAERMDAKANIFDTSSYVTESELRCLRNAGYSVGAFQVYDRGEVSRFLQNVQRAINVGLSAELTVDPQLTGNRSATDQYKQIIKSLTDSGYRVRRLWLRVTNPIEWGQRSQIDNVKFIKEFISAGEKDDVYIGIFTNWYDWQQITGDSTAVSPHSLWYWQANSDGRSNGDFGDFVEFGGLPRPLIKQFITNYRSCYTQISIDLSANGFREAVGQKDFIPFGGGVTVTN